MSLYGMYYAYCANCGKKILTDACGHHMWRSGGGHYRVCDKECHDAMDIKHTRSIMGKNTLTEEIPK